MLNSPTQNAAAMLPAVRSITLGQPLHWLALAWRDLVACGWISWAHGLVTALGGLAVAFVARDRFWLLAGAFPGFLLVAPILATSLYALSRARERGEAPGIHVVLKTWLNWQDHHFNKWGNDYWCMAQFGALLALAGTGWLLTSAALITLLAPYPISTLTEFLQHVVLAKDGFLLELWLALGGVMVAPIFASSVVAVPLLLDRRVTLWQAVLTSWMTVLENPVPMALWALLLSGITLLGMSLALFGLVLALPLLGHASWHAYRDLVDASSFTLREAA